MSELNQIKAQKSAQIKEKIAKLPNIAEIKNNVSVTNQKIAERNNLKFNLSAVRSFLEDQEQTPEIKKKLGKINLQIQKLELEIKSNRLDRVDLGDEIAEVVNKEKKEKVKEAQNSDQSQIQTNNLENGGSAKNRVGILIERLKKVRSSLENADPVQRLELEAELAKLEEALKNEPTNLTLWYEVEGTQAELKDFFKPLSPKEIQNRRNIEMQRESYERLGLDYENAPKTLTELISLLQITIKNLGGNSFDNNSNLEYWSAEKDKLIKIELSDNGNSFCLAYMEFVDKPAPIKKNFFEKILSIKKEGNKNKSGFDSDFDTILKNFKRSYGEYYPIFVKLLSQRFSDKTPTRFVLYGNSNNQQEMGYFQCLTDESGNAGKVNRMYLPNNTYVIREVYREIHDLFSEQFGTQKKL